MLVHNQTNINPFIFDPSLGDRCYCAKHLDKPAKTYTVNIYPNHSKGLFYIDLPEYKGTVIMKISDTSGTVLETHHLMYSGLMSWRLMKGIWKVKLIIEQKFEVSYMVIVL